MAEHDHVSAPSLFRPRSSLPDNVLEKIFVSVCPHARDSSYRSSEDAMESSDCPSCDLRDLAHCSLVNREWKKGASLMLYVAVHFRRNHEFGNRL